MERILTIAPLGIGGMTSMMLNIQAGLNHEEYNYDYLVFRDKVEPNEKAAIELGGRKIIADVEHIHNKVLNRIVKMIKITRICRKNKYKIFHLNAEPAYEVLTAIAAKLGGVKYVIYHSHNGNATANTGYRALANKLCKKIMPLFIDEFLACSDVAATFSFPKSIVEQKKYTVINNGVDTEKFKYDVKTRNEKRKEYGLENNFVIGHVGRFTEQKNHTFLIDIFNELHKLDSSAVLVLFGTGELVEPIMEKINRLNLKDSVRYMGTSDEMEKMWQMMDIFLFPSLFEGLPVSGIEAQAAGLPMVISDTISREVKLTELVEYMSLEESPVSWAKKVLEKKNQQRQDVRQDIIDAGYDIKHTVEQMEKIYLAAI